MQCNRVVKFPHSSRPQRLLGSQKSSLTSCFRYVSTMTALLKQAIAPWALRDIPAQTLANQLAIQ